VYDEEKEEEHDGAPTGRGMASGSSKPRYTSLLSTFLSSPASFRRCWGMGTPMDSSLLESAFCMCCCAAASIAAMSIGADGLGFNKAFLEGFLGGATIGSGGGGGTPSWGGGGVIRGRWRGGGEEYRMTGHLRAVSIGAALWVRRLAVPLQHGTPGRRLVGRHGVPVRPDTRRRGAPVHAGSLLAGSCSGRVQIRTMLKILRQGNNKYNRED